jgi:hypothetical protein
MSGGLCDAAAGVVGLLVGWSLMVGMRVSFQIFGGREWGHGLTLTFDEQFSVRAQIDFAPTATTPEVGVVQRQATTPRLAHGLISHDMTRSPDRTGSCCS